MKTSFLNAVVGNSINVCVTGKRKRESNCNKTATKLQQNCNKVNIHIKYICIYILIVFSVLPKFYEKMNKRPSQISAHLK